jgi:hypothetical protein
MKKVKELIGRGLVEGVAKGPLIKSVKPLSFLGGVNPKNGIIQDSNNPLYGKTIKGKVLFLPYTVGSTVGVYIFYQLKKNNLNPVATLTRSADIVLVSACTITNVPLIDGIEADELPDEPTIVQVDGKNGKVLIFSENLPSSKKV